MEIEYKEIAIRSIQEAEINPQIMGEDDFKRLVANIKKDGVLTSSPLIMQLSDSKYICISGHHRIKAAIKAGLKKIVCAIIQKVDDSTRLRLQLTHNDISGTPDPEIVRQLQAKITEEDLKLCDILIEQSKQEDETLNVEIPQYRYVNICLLPESKEVFTDLIQFLQGDESDKYLIEKQDYEKLKDLLTIAFEAGFKTPGRAIRRFLDIVEMHKHELDGA
jgi:hypothetical protein